MTKTLRTRRVVLSSRVAPEELPVVNTIEDWKKLIQYHDLTYSYSDDHSVWRSGQRVYDHIVETSKQFPRKDVVAAWNSMVDTKVMENARSTFYWKNPL